MRIFRIKYVYLSPFQTASRRASKTLPRGFSLQSAANGDMSSLDCDVFGLYGELLNVRDYDCESGDIAQRNPVSLPCWFPEKNMLCF